MTLINCDLGECLTPDPDPKIMPLIDMANIACGGHAGDARSMSATIEMAKQNGVMIGAHPSYFDRENFGRVSHDLSPSDLFASLRQQLAAFIALCETHEVAADYIKPHGALYHDMMHKPVVLEVICDVLRSLNPQLKLVVQAGVHTERMQLQATQTQLTFLYEAFADRGYRGIQMIPRSEEGAMLATAEEILEQVQAFNTSPSFAIDTICFHSDHLPSVAALQRLKS